MENPITQAIASIPVLYNLLFLILLLLAMYWARRPFHRCMAAFGRIVYNAMRLASASVKLAEHRLNARNREVLLSAGLELAERKVEREFERISTVVKKDLEGYPKVQRKATANLQKLEEEFENCHVIPQALPDWFKVIDAIANIKPPGDRVVVTMLEEIHRTLKEQHKTALERHRQDVTKRHTILSRMLPVWRSTQKTLENVQKSITNLHQRSKKIDRYMDAYEKIRDKDEIAERQLCSSSLTQFFISGLVLAIAVVGVMINFNLAAMPMSETVAGTSYIGAFKTSNVISMFIVSLQIVFGFFLMDALRITRLFSIIGNMDDRKRKIFFWSLLGVLTALAAFESSLAFVQDRITTDMETLRQTLNGVEATKLATSNSSAIGQMIMGFMLPFILIFIAIPFESFVSSARTVLGMVAAWGLRTLRFGLRLIGNLGFYMGRMVNNIYDLMIFPALWVEGVIVQKISRKSMDVNPKEEKMRVGQSPKNPTTLIKERASCNEASK